MCDNINYVNETKIRGMVQQEECLAHDKHPPFNDEKKKKM